VLGTLAEFHQEPIPYDLEALVKLVVKLQPDLLCLDMTEEKWVASDFDNLPPEYRQGLIPLANQSDIVVVPIGEKDQSMDYAVSRWRTNLIAWLHDRLAALQRRASGPAAVNQGWRHELANLLYYAIVMLEGSLAAAVRKDHVQDLVSNVLEAASRDPGCRMLVVVNVQYCHRIRPLLGQIEGIQVVSYEQL
jgi:hypothetical protein